MTILLDAIVRRCGQRLLQCRQRHRLVGIDRHAACVLAKLLTLFGKDFSPALSGSLAFICSCTNCW
ncbi:MAG: hypothetical protein WAO71_06890 [Gallionella sp.]